ncbi:MAG TPA: Spy/CpxP family protein refolding chaperone [Blastocatellia bacterium]
MKRFTTLKMALAVVFAFAMFGTVAMAQTGQATTPSTTSTTTGGPGAGGWHGHHRGGFMGMALFKKLNLTADQQQQIKSIFSAHMTNMKSYQAQLKALREENPSVDKTTGAFNESASLEFHQKAAPVMAAMEKERNAIHTETLAVLTLEQRTQYTALQAQMRAQFQQNRANWQSQHAQSSGSTTQQQ